MIKLLTIYFLILGIIHLIRGGYLKSISTRSLKERLELTKDKDNLDNEALQTNTIQMVLIAVLVFVYTIIQLIYFISVESIDIYKYPTLIMIVLLAISIVRVFVDKKDDFSTDLIKEEDRVKLQSVLTKSDKIKISVKLYDIIEILYFGYIAYLLFIKM